MGRRQTCWRCAAYEPVGGCAQRGGGGARPGKRAPRRGPDGGCGWRRTLRCRICPAPAPPESGSRRVRYPDTRLAGWTSDNVMLCTFESEGANSASAHIWVRNDSSQGRSRNIGGGRVGEGRGDLADVKLTALLGIESLPQFAPPVEHEQQPLSAARLPQLRSSTTAADSALTRRLCYTLNQCTF